MTAPHPCASLFLQSLYRNTFVVDLGYNLDFWINSVNWQAPSVIGYTMPGEILNSARMQAAIMSGQIEKIDEYYATEIHLWVRSRKAFLTNVNSGITYLYNIL